MPVFNAHLPAERFSAEQKRAFANALNQSLVQALGIPAGDRFIILSEHREDELFLDPTFMGMHRSADAIIITVLLGAHRPLQEKRTLIGTICELTTAALGISPDDVFVALIPVPNENFSFGRGELQLAEKSPQW